jgi:hypothetical protein
MTDTTDMTAEETAQHERLLADLHADGYRQIDHHNDLQAGARVRHAGDQYPGAYRSGTGTVLTVTEKRHSSWSVVYGMPDVELVVLFDVGTGRPRLSRLAQYHVEVVDVAP